MNTSNFDGYSEQQRRRNTRRTIETRMSVVRLENGDDEKHR